MKPKHKPDEDENINEPGTDDQIDGLSIEEQIDAFVEIISNVLLKEME